MFIFLGVWLLTFYFFKYSFLSHEIESEGLFRLSGSSSDVSVYKSMWNMGITVDYEKVGVFIFIFVLILLIEFLFYV